MYSPLQQCAGASLSYVLLRADSLGHEGYVLPDADSLGHVDYALLGAGFLQRAGYVLPDEDSLPREGCVLPDDGGYRDRCCGCQDSELLESVQTLGYDFRLYLLSRCDLQVRQFQCFHEQSAGLVHGCRCTLRCDLTNKHAYLGCGH